MLITTRKFHLMKMSIQIYEVSNANIKQLCLRLNLNKTITVVRNSFLNRKHNIDEIITINKTHGCLCTKGKWALLMKIKEWRNMTQNFTMQTIHTNKY